MNREAHDARATDSLQYALKEELENLDKKFVRLQHINDSLEAENKKLSYLVDQLANDNGKLQVELKALKQNNDNGSILQVLRNSSIYGVSNILSTAQEY